MSQKLSRMLYFKSGLFFLVLLIFTGITIALDRWDVAIVQLVVVAALFIWHLTGVLRQRKEAARYLDGLLAGMDQASQDSTLNCPLPLVMFHPNSGEVIWSNDRFLRLAGSQDSIFDSSLSELVPNFGF